MSEIEQDRAGALPRRCHAGRARGSRRTLAGDGLHRAHRLDLRAGLDAHPLCLRCRRRHAHHRHDADDGGRGRAGAGARLRARAVAARPARALGRAAHRPVHGRIFGRLLHGHRNTCRSALTVVTFYTYPLHDRAVRLAHRTGAVGAAGLVALAVGLSRPRCWRSTCRAGASASSAPPGRCWARSGFSAVLILSALLLPRRSDTRPRTLVMLATASVACILAPLASGEIWFPTTALGWGGLLGSALCYAVAMTSILFFAAVLGATRVAVVMNVEPIASLVFTFLILGERLRPIQLVGALFVVAAIFLFRPRRARASGRERGARLALTRQLRSATNSTLTDCAARNSRHRRRPARANARRAGSRHCSTAALRREIEAAGDHRSPSMTTILLCAIFGLRSTKTGMPASRTPRSRPRRADAR